MSPQESANDRMSAAEFQKQHAGHSEESLHRSCVQWARMAEGKYPELKGLFHPRGGSNKSRAAAGKMKAMGGQAGVPDLVLPVVRVVTVIQDGEETERSAGGLWIELKSKSGRLRQSQRRFRHLLVHGGQAWTLVRSFDRFKETVLRYLNGDFVLDVSRELNR